MAGPLALLLVAADAALADRLEPRLRAIAAATVVRITAAQATAAPATVLVVLVGRDRAALDTLRHLGLPLVLFVGDDDRAFMAEAIAAGVTSYTVVDAVLPDVEPIVRAAIALFDRHRALAAERDAARASLHERETVDRAKAMLMKQRQLDEPQAYRWLRRRAMNESKRIATIAAELLAASADDPAR